MTNNRNTVVLIGNHYLTIYNFRQELIERLVQTGYRVVVMLPYTAETEKIRQLGCETINVPVDRHGMNPFLDGKLLLRYHKLLKQLKPKLVFTYTVKPNIYGGFACRMLKLPYVCTITGLGKGIEKGGLIRQITLTLYKVALKKAQRVYFQNEANQHLFESRNIGQKRYGMVKGSGVNLEHFSYKPFPAEKEPIRFIFVARIEKSKGIDTFLAAAETIKKKYSNTEFHILGFWEEDYKERVIHLVEKGVIYYHGMQPDVVQYLEKCQCLVHPSQSEEHRKKMRLLQKLF